MFSAPEYLLPGTRVALHASRWAALYMPGDPLPAGAVFARSTTATRVDNASDTVLVQFPSSNLSSATIARSTTATYAQGPV